jgi:hypothetical protein
MASRGIRPTRRTRGDEGLRESATGRGAGGQGTATRGNARTNPGGGKSRSKQKTRK